MLLAIWLLRKHGGLLRHRLPVCFRQMYWYVVRYPLTCLIGIVVARDPYTLLIAKRTTLIRSVLKSSIIIRYSISVVCNSVTVIRTPVNAFNSHEYVSTLLPSPHWIKWLTFCSRFPKCGPNSWHVRLSERPVWTYRW